MTRTQTLFFTCPHCDERFAQIEELDRDIHTGETYHSDCCGVQVIRRCPLRTTSLHPGQGGTATSAHPNPASSARQRRFTMRKERHHETGSTSQRGVCAKKRIG